MCQPCEAHRLSPVTALHANAPCTQLRLRSNVGLLLGQSRRRWPNNKPTLGQRHVCAVHIYSIVIEGFHTLLLVLKDFFRMSNECDFQ